MCGSPSTIPGDQDRWELQSWELELSGSNLHCLMCRAWTADLLVFTEEVCSNGSCPGRWSGLLEQKNIRIAQHNPPKSSGSGSGYYSCTFCLLLQCSHPTPQHLHCSRGDLDLSGSNLHCLMCRAWTADLLVLTKEVCSNGSCPGRWSGLLEQKNIRIG